MSLKVLKFSAQWCAPCRMMKTVVDNVLAQFPDVELEEVDIDKNGDKAIDMNVMAVPTLIFLKNNKVVDRLVGSCTEKELKELIEKCDQ